MERKSKIFIGHAVIMSKEFNGYAYYDSDLVGCRLGNFCYASKEFSFLEMKDDGTYTYNDKECLAISLEDIDLSDEDEVYACDMCQEYVHEGMLNCSRTARIPGEIVGFVGVVPLLEYTNVDDEELAIMLIKEYNETVIEQNVVITKQRARIMQELNGANNSFSERKETEARRRVLEIKKPESE